MTDTADVTPRPYRMHNQIQTYAWGTRDADAFIPHLLGMIPEPGVPTPSCGLGRTPRLPRRSSCPTAPV